MSGLSFVLLAVVAVMSLGAQQTPGTGKDKVVMVELVFDTIDNHQKACKAGGVPATSILVAGKVVRHCVGGVLLDHDADEKRNPEIFKQTLVQVSAGESIGWFSKDKKTRFRVIQVERHPPHRPGGPAYPFMELMPTQFSTQVNSSGVLDLAYAVAQQYKISFEIEGLGRIDPDVVCSF